MSTVINNLEADHKGIIVIKKLKKFKKENFNFNLKNSMIQFMIIMVQDLPQRGQMEK